MSDVFDLFGDPVPEGWGRRGRPQHIATRENRNKVMMLLAFGWNNDRIARAIAITPPTLRKNYFRELRQRMDMRDRLDASLAMRLWQQVEQGNVGAMREFNKLLERNDRMAAEAAMGATDKPEPRAGKKVVDAQRAIDADADLMAEIDQEAAAQHVH